MTKFIVADVYVVHTNSFYKISVHELGDSTSDFSIDPSFGFLPECGWMCCAVPFGHHIDDVGEGDFPCVSGTSETCICRENPFRFSFSK